MISGSFAINNGDKLLRWSNGQKVVEIAKWKGNDRMGIYIGGRSSGVSTSLTRAQAIGLMKLLKRCK